MFDNDNLCETPQQPYSMSKIQKQTTPFHLSKQQSISEIAPDTQRSLNGPMNLRGSLENIYGLIGDEAMHNYAGHTADHMMVRVPQNLGEEDLSVMQESARSVLRQNQLLTNMINPIANTTTDFYSEYRGGFHPGTNQWLGSEGMMPHISDFEDQANHSPFVNRGGSTPFVKHQRDQSANLILDSVQRRGVPAKNQGPLGGRAAQVTVFMDDQSQHFDTTYLDENEDDYSPQLSGINLIVWGRNQSGQLGIESSQQSVIKQPQLVPHLDRIFGRGFSQVKSIACGKAHACLLIERDSGELSLYTMGSNNRGQLGVGKSLSASSEPVMVSDSLAFIKVAASKYSTFAITDQGLLYSWGSNKDGLLGLGSTSDQSLPQQVNFGDSVVLEVSAGKDHAFAIVQERSPIAEDQHELVAFSWGSNKHGQLGQGSYTSVSKPKEVQLRPGSGNESCETLTVPVKEHQPIRVSCGDKFTILQTHNGALLSCGVNIQGQLGLNSGVVSSKTNRFNKMRFHPEASEVSKLTSSDFTACVMKSGDLYLWGPTPVGQFNEPLKLQDYYKPNQGVLKVKDLSLGSNFGVLQDQDLQCYQLGSLFREGNAKQQYDSNASGAQKLNISSNIQPLKGGPIALSALGCGQDFVIKAVSNQSSQVDNLRRFLIQTQGRKANTSRSIGAVQGNAAFNLRRDLQQEFNLIKQNSNTIYGQEVRAAGGRYAFNPQQQSICSSLSPLRTSLMKSETAPSNRRNDYLNRSAIISTQQVNMQLQTLTALRESVTPVKEFAPPSNGLDLNCSQARKIEEVYRTGLGKNEEAFPQASNYSTLQDDRANHKTQSAYNTAHLIHTPPPASEQKQQRLALNLPLQLTSSITSNQLPLLSNRGGQSVEYIDIIIKEKQELQHSLNVEIQRRLLLEREIQQTLNGSTEDKVKLQKQLDQLRTELERARAERREALVEKDASLEALKLVQAQVLQGKQDAEALRARVDGITQENEALKLQIVSSSSLGEQSKREFSTLEESLSKKTKEIYDLTVQLGCLKEENNQYKLEQEELKEQFQVRIDELKNRAETDYQQLLEDYQTFQKQCKIESDTVDALRRKSEDQAGKIKDQEEKIRRLQAMNDKLRSQSRLKKASQFKLEQPSSSTQIDLSADQPASSHYTSVGGNENKKPSSQEQSFQSIGSKRSKGASANLRATQRLEKENEVHKTPEEGVKEAAKKPQHQQLVSHSSNLFKKAHQPVLHTINAEGITNRQNTNRDQGCLQINPNRKKSAGAPSTVKTSLAFGSAVLKPNSSKLNAANQPTTTLQAKPLNPKEKTPTRPLARSDLSHQHLLQPTLNKSIRPATSNISKSPLAASHQTSQLQKSPQLQPKAQQKAIVQVQKQSHVMSAVSSQNTFQLNSNEDSIFDPKLLNNQMVASEEPSLLKHRRSSQQSFTLIQRNPQQEVTLGGIQCDESSSPDTPQIAPGMILHQQEKPTAYVMRSLESPTRILKQHAFNAISQSTAFDEGIRRSQQIQQQLLLKNASVSSSTSNGQHAQIMSEMRNKLIDIQNNKQYIEQKIQEYEKKLQQLKGTSSSLVLSGNHLHHFQNQSIQQAYTDIPRQQQHSLQRSGSGMLLQSHREKSQR